MTNIMSFVIKEDTIKKIDTLRKAKNISRSKALREMIDYFYDNKKLFEEIS